MPGSRQNAYQPDDDGDDDWDEDSDDNSSEWNDDESETQPCPCCRREIHEDAERCPYCERYLSDEDQKGRAPDKPLWFIIGFVLCVIVMFYWLIGLN